MVAVFTGNALGLFDTSLTQLGSGLSSDASRHRQAVNAANGNLVLQGLDELLTFRGLPVSATRTYNSQGTFGDTGADGWVTGFERRVELIGQLNDANSVVRLHTSEGDVVDFAYTGTANKYRSTAGEGAHDTIDWAPSETGTSYWILNEGSTRRRDYFKSLDGEPNQGRLHQIREVKSDGVTPTYFLVDYNEAGQVTGVRSADGSGHIADALLFDYADGRLTSISTRENGAIHVQVRYGYDAAGRLEWVEHDLTPKDTTDNAWNISDASANDGRLYRTTYSYVDATSLRIATVRGSDGTLTSYTYDTSGRVKTVTRGDTDTDDADGLGETLTFTYDPGNLRTHVVDSLGRMWSYVYDESGQLKEHYGPARDGLRDATYYQYDTAGNLTHTRTQRGSTVLAQKDYEYDSNGNMTWEWDALGNAIQRTYTTSNQVASQTVYSGTDPDRTGPTLPTGGATTRLVYDGQHKLRFVIGAAGEVSEIQYATSGNGVGQQNASRTYLGAAYSGGYTEAELSAWASGQRGNSTLTEFLYDAKGRLERRLEYGAVDPATGTGEIDSRLAVTRFAYDAQGLLRTQWTVRAGDRLAANAGSTASDSVVDYVYDGMGRLLDIVQRGGNITFVNGVTDAGTLADATTLVTRNSYVDSAMQLQVTHDSGATRLEVRNAAGRVISTVDSASGQASRTTQNFYDTAGQLRASQDANGGRTYFFYDERGNVAAEVDATGAVTEYVRDSLGRVVQTLAHADRVDTTGWIASGKVVKSIVSEIRPGWTVDFSSSTIPVLDAANLSGTYDDGFRVEDGRLVVQRAEYATSVNPRVRSTDVHALSEGAFYSAEITTDASITPTYLLFSLQNNQSGDAYRRVGAYISNGSLYRNVRVGDVNTNTLIGALSADTTYVIEAYASEGGIQYHFYAKGQDRDNGFSFSDEAVASEWSQVRLQINGAMGPGQSGPPIYVDNLRHSLVRRTDREYDTAGRLVRETDGTAVTTYEYDGASRLVRTVRSAPGETDRVIRYFHDASGRSLGTLDAEGYLVENQYDLAGRLVRTVRYATATDIADRASGDLDTLRPDAHTQDQTERLFYDGRGQLVGRLDAEGYLTQSVFDEVGNDRATLSYGLRLTGLGGTENLATLVDAADGGVIRQSLRTYNALGQVISESNHEGTLTRFYYDDAGRMVRSESAALTTEVRNGTHWYDAFGQLIGELDGQGSVDGSGALRITDGMTDAQKLAVFTAHGVRHSYDVLGRRIESIDAEGNRTWYFYDARGRQTYTVRGVANGATKNALGEVTETRYNAFGQVSETLAYTGRIAIASPYSRGQVQTAITALSFVAAVDSRQQYSYDSRGLLVSQISAEGHVSHLRYTGHGQLLERTDFDGTSAEVTTRYQYDLRGLLVGQTDAVGVAGVERNSLQTHDAFGRVTASTDARGNTVNMAYDRLGRLIDQRQVIQGRTSNAVTSYDAWNRVLVSTNAMGQRTTYSYDDAARSVVVTTEEGLSVSTTRNRFGDTLTITDNAGAVTTYQYDRDGRQTQVTNPVLNVGTTEYTARGLVARTVDGTGLVTAYTYDAVGRVLTRIEDPSGLALTTTYAYDGQGRAVTVTDANGKATTTTYDRDGRVLTVARDPSGLNLRTQYTWDAAGRQLSVTEGFGTFAARTVAYAYDALGRRTTETVDPGFLDLITRYTYDANGNAVARTDAEGHVTRYVYNQANRLVFTIDPAGGVTRQWYDEAGRVVAVRQYAAFISLDAADRAAIESGNGADSLTRITNKVNAIDNDAVDRIEYRVFDNDGRLRYSIDALGNTRETRYDAAGRAAHRLAYLTPIALSAALKTSLLQTANQTESGHTGLLAEVAALLAPHETAAQASYSIFDGAGRERFAVTRAVVAGNTVGLVTERHYNEDGQVSRLTEHLATIAYDPARTISEITAALAAGGSADPDKVRVTDYVYDQAGRLRFTVDDLRVVNERRYDDLGRVVESRLYMAPVSAGLAMTEAALDAALPDATGFRKTTHLYDAAGRLTRSTDALGKYESFGYDTVGNRTSYTNKLNKTWTYAYDAAGRMVEERTPAVSVYRYSAANGFALATETLPIVTRMTYDGLGNVLSRTENAEAVAANERRTTEYTYDARGYQIRTKFPDAGRIDEATGNLVASNVRPEILVTYDALGRAVVQKDVLGNYSYKVYDQAGRLSHEVDAAGYVTAYTYNAQGQQTKLVRYATAIDTAAMTGWATGTAISLAKISTTGVITADATNDRSLSTYYDARGLKTEVRQSSISYWTSAGTSTSGSPRTTFTYDVLGQLVRESVLLEGSTWANTHHYYDQAGRRYMTVDAEGYVTAMEYDAAGQETIRIEFARAVDKAALNVSTPPALPAPGDLSTGYDRAVTSEYDALGRKTGEATQRLFQNGDGSSGVREVETSFEYDAEGNQTAVVVDGVRTTKSYDALGRLWNVIDSERLVLKGNRVVNDPNHWAIQLTNAGVDLESASLYETIKPYTVMYYDAFGNAVRVIRYANGRLNDQAPVADSDNDQWTYTRYDWQGRAVATRDALNNASFTEYDAADRAVHTWSDLEDGQGGTLVVHGRYTYDAVGRQITSVMSRGAGEDPAIDALEAVRYNAFGEIIRKGTDLASLVDGSGGYATFNYDRAGNATFSNQQQGNRWYRYNLAGHQVHEERDWFDATGTAVRVRNTNQLDLLGRVTGVVTPSHTTDAGLTSTTTRRLDRWGNVLEEVDPRGNTTNWVYNDRNQAIRQFAPRVLVVGADGSESWQRPETRWMYDAAGRLVGVRDANGHTDRNEYDDAGRLIRSIDALGNATVYGYDGLGRGVAQQDALGYITTRGYDRLDRVTEQGDYLTDATGTTRTAHAREAYDLNQRGDRIQVTNALGQTQRYNYDSRGLMIRSQTAAGVVMRYAYDAWGNKSREDNGLNAYQTWTFDVLGRQASHRDLGGNVYTYGYDTNGQRKTETATVDGLALNRKITYYPNGQIRRIELSATDYTEHQYDAAGNRTYERTVNTSRGVDMVTKATYDSHNRLSRVTTDDLVPNPDKRILDLEYAYDAVGNRRRVIAHSGYGPGVDPLSTSNLAPLKQADIPNVTLKHGQAHSWRWTPGDYFTDPDGQLLNYTLSLEPSGSLPVWLSYSRDVATGEWVFAYTGTGTLNQTVSLRMTASDGSASAYDVFTVKLVGNTAPVVVPPTTLEIRHKTGDSLFAELQVDDLFYDSDIGDSLTLSLSGTVPAWLSVEVLGGTLRLSAAPGAVPAGNHNLTLRATDASGASATRTLTLRAAVAAGPTGSAIAEQTAVANESFLFETPISAVFVDPNGDAFSVTAALSNGNPLPSWLSYAVVTENGAQKLSFFGDVPASATDNQLYTVRLTAVDTDGMTGTRDFGIRISNPPPNVGPVYNAGTITDKTIAARSPWTYTLPSNAFTDANGDTLTYSASARTWIDPVPPGPFDEPGFPGYWVLSPLPSWLTFNSATRTFQGTPPDGTGAQIRVTARDPSMASASRDFTLSVSEFAPIYNNSLTNKSAKEGDAVNIPLPSNAFTDPNGDALAYTAHVWVGSSWVGLGTLGLGINASTGTITGTINSAPLGSYQVRITASDGSDTVTGTFTLTVNRKPTAPANTSASVILGVAFSKTVPGFSDPEGGTLAFTATTSTGAALPSWLSVNASNGTLSGTPPTGFTGLAVLVRATDPAGLWASTSVTINVVNPPPQYVAGKIPGSFTLSGGNAWSYQFPLDAFSNLPTAEAVTFTARLNSGAALPAWLSFNAGTRTFSGPPPVNSSTTVVLQATDAAGGVATTTFTITGTNEPPVYNGTLTGQSIVFGRSVNLPLPANAFTEPNHQALTYTAQVWRPTYYVLEPGNAEPTEYPAAWISLSNVGLYINASTGTITGTGKSLNYGFNVTRWSYQIKITASDGSSSAEGTFSAGVQRPPVPPASTTVTVNANQAINRQITFTDPEGGALTYSASGLPSGVTMNSTGRLSSTGKPAGSYAFSVTATDPTGVSTTASFTLVVQNNAPVVAATIPNKAAVRGQAWSLNVAGTFTDPNGDTLTWSASGLPAGISFNTSTKVLSGTPTGTGVSTITLTANDGKGGVTSTSFTLTVTAPAANQAPIVATPITDQYSMWNRNWSFTVPIGTFTDPNGDPLTYSASGMPSGMTFNASTRTFAFYTPKITTGAHYNLTVTASDGRGGSVSDTFSLDVEPWEDIGGGPGGPGGMMSVGGGESLFAAMSQSVAMAESTDQAMAMSAPEPEMVQTQSMTVTPGVNQQISWYTYDAENRVQIVNGTLDEGLGQIVAAPPSLYQSSYEVQYDAVGRESAQIFHTESGLTVHRIDYTERGERRRTFSQIAGSAQGMPTAVNSYDNAGRLTRTVSLFGSGTQGHYYDGEGYRRIVNLGGVISSVVDYVYDADGRLVSQTTRGRKANPQDTAMSPSHPDYDPYRATAAHWLDQMSLGGATSLPPGERTYDPQNNTLTVLDEVKYSNASGVSAYDAAGRVTTYRYIKSGSAWRPGSGYSEQEQQTFTHTYAFTYAARDGYLEASVSGTSSNETRFKATTTTSTYDSAGRRTQILDSTPIPDQDSIQSKREFAYTADGQILTRRDFYLDGSTWEQGRDEGSYPLQNVAPTVISNEDWIDLGKPAREAWYDARDNQRLTYVNGQLVATQNEAGKLDVTGQLTGFSNTQMGRTQVQVQQGDTLRSLAQRVYGNENLWYVLADANGLDGDDALVAGSSLTVPEVKTSSNDAATFKPYDPSEITGPTTPSLPYIPPPDAGCGTMGMIIMVIVIIVVTVYTAGAAAGALGVTGTTTTAAGATAAASTSAVGATALAGTAASGVTLGTAAAGSFAAATSVGTALAASAGVGGLVGSIAGQAVGSAMGVASFNWRSALASGASAAITSGLGTANVFGGLAGQSAFVRGAASAVSGNLVNQATQRLAGVETSFSWKSIAASAVSGGIAASMTPMIGKAFNANTENGQTAIDLVGAATGGIVSLHVRRQFGMGDDVNYGAIVGDAFGTMLANRLTGQHRLAAAEAKAAQQLSSHGESMTVGSFESGDAQASVAENGMLSATSGQSAPLAAAKPFDRRGAIYRLNSLFDTPLNSDISNADLKAMLRDYAPELSGDSAPATTLATLHVDGAAQLRRDLASQGFGVNRLTGTMWAGAGGGGGGPVRASSGNAMSPQGRAGFNAYNAFARWYNETGDNSWAWFDSTTVGQMMQGTSLRDYAENQRVRFPEHTGQDLSDEMSKAILPVNHEMAVRGREGTVGDAVVGYYTGLGNEVFGLYNGTIGSSTAADLSAALFGGSWRIDPMHLADTELSGAALAEFNFAALNTLLGTRLAGVRRGGVADTLPNALKPPIPRVNVADEFMFRANKNGSVTLRYGNPEGVHGLIVNVDRQGVLGFDIRSTPGNSWSDASGTDMFASAMQRLEREGVQVNAIRGVWVEGADSVNAAQYLSNLSRGMAPQQAAANTWTGQMAARYGYTNVGMPNTGYSTTTVIFGR